MGNSIESRLPFMDYRLMELGVALPEALKLRAGYGKWVLREAIGHRVPSRITHPRTKRGFDVDTAAWVSSGLGAAIREALAQTRSAFRDVVSPGLILTDHFSDSRLSKSRSAFADAVALLWLGGWATGRAL